ncbi:hypothetical protein GVK83_01905 [Enterococcus hirae]|uniref:Uncharacterized protein n=1 Tax=Enterococcus hirae (strain ATCC 9790 / DSM 20160 / JCM 8729 / LMG 6399 / NBRC 3181 / NCIMB 6459 / NCDO 1258 / NCTC 12367 / WDCM 00089 / R) TaxID=768486 RepID=I6RYG8_ENTHA|nr:hypothetical protein [Enterococcus hirae]AFM69425.1 hypothetical protein EHR_02215 [Enterococcus hirae ATCC 9790]EMF0035032.1 hypothetical protein [Enterococcus hirae]EMF0070091.1 hypothetical protein [Enterococcus hirae]EMF0092233.1 hypothetical protein [Enterococcus hirae]EMF0099128.1 hypothetical protein [Enterococcus hirae]
MYRWIQEVKKYKASAFLRKGNALFDAHDDMKKLEQEKHYLREERGL